MVGVRGDAVVERFFDDVLCEGKYWDDFFRIDFFVIIYYRFL